MTGGEWLPADPAPAGWTYRTLGLRVEEPLHRRVEARRAVGTRLGLEGCAANTIRAPARPAIRLFGLLRAEGHSRARAARYL
ncbi:hypothetical protein ACFVT2_12000 [Streptomyces sp. NPDC058000]|uniref:hypothetical protein n=1 Tax=Streptomyces sp. NPDC058000 TaxID=3346299 RepID=UPI0036E1FA65